MSQGPHYTHVEIDGVRFTDEVSYINRKEGSMKDIIEFNEFTKKVDNVSTIRGKQMEQIKREGNGSPEKLKEAKERLAAQKAVQANGLIYGMLDKLKLPYDTKTSDLVKVLVETPEYLTLPSGLAHPYVGVCLFAYFKSEFVFIQHRAIKCVCGKIHKVEKGGLNKKYISCPVLGYKEQVHSFPMVISKVMLHMIKFLYEALVKKSEHINGAQIVVGEKPVEDQESQMVTHVDMAEGESKTTEQLIEIGVGDEQK
jgi:hypothetical protein